MDEAFLARRFCARNMHADRTASKKPKLSTSDANGQQVELGPLHILLSSPPPERPRRRANPLKATAKGLIVAAHCHGWLGVEVTQALIDRLGLREA